MASNPVTEFLLSRLAEEKIDTLSLALHEEIVMLFNSFRGRLLRYAVSLSLPVADGEDVVQDAFLVLYRHLRQGRSRENLPGWLFRVTHHLALKRRMRYQLESRMANDRQHPLLCVCDSTATPEEQILVSERHSHLQAVLRALPEIDRCCLLLRAEGLRYREIAETLGISLGSVSNSLARSLARMERTGRR